MHKVRSVLTTFKRAASDVRRACVRAWLAATTSRARASRWCDGATAAACARDAHAPRPSGLAGESDARSCEDGRSTVPAARP